MKFLLATLLVLGGTQAFAQSSDSDQDTSADYSQNTLWLTGPAAEAIYNKLTAPAHDTGEQIQPELEKKAPGVTCRMHMNGSPTDCRLFVGARGVIAKIQK